MTNDREYLSIDEACAMLPDGDAIRATTEPLPGTIVVATWTRGQLIELFHSCRPELSGPIATKAGYEIAVEREDKLTLFVQTKE